MGPEDQRRIRIKGKVNLRGSYEKEQVYFFTNTRRGQAKVEVILAEERCEINYVFVTVYKYIF